MSAFCGLLHLDGAPASPTVLRRMAEASAHRAPDGTRYWRSGNAGLAHLAFHVTPEAEHDEQPSRDAKTGSVLVADLRLDNRPELLSALADHTPVLTSSPGDAALLLAAYKRWGHGCLSHLRGDFVFAIWDKLRQEIFFARDALGARSACFHWNGRRLLIASEPSQLLSAADVPPDVNCAVVADYLAMRTPSDATATYFRGIQFVPPGHGCVASASGLRQWRYWGAAAPSAIRYSRDMQYAEHFRELLERSARARMRTNGVVGLSLSGGLDSALLASVVSPVAARERRAQNRVATFSYVFNEHESCDERRFIEPLLSSCGLAPGYVFCDDEWTLRDVSTWQCELDAIWWNAFAGLSRSLQVAATAAGCRVLLNGQFGDSLFPGTLRGPARTFADSALAAAKTRALFPHRLARRARAWRTRFRQHRSAPYSHMHSALRKQSRARWWAEAGRGPEPPMDFPHWARGAGEARKAANRRGLEVESPYFDRAIVEFMAAVPSTQINHGRRHRIIQRNTMRLSGLPEALASRRGKTSVYPLMEEGLLQRERHTFRRILSQGRSVDGALVDGDWLRRAIRDDEALAKNLEPLWLVCALELWLERVEAARSEVVRK